MMTKYLAFLAAMLCGSAVYAQCTVNSSFIGSAHGLYPSGAFLRDCGGLTATKTFIPLVSTGFPGINDLGRVRLVYIDGLPTGLVAETDVMATADAESPYGLWTYGGSYPNYVSVPGCVRISGSSTAWAQAAVGGPNGDGVYPLFIAVNYEMEDNGWNAVPLNLTQYTFQLRVNEFDCDDQLYAVSLTTADDHETVECDGTATVEVYNGTPPYSYLWSVGDSTSSFLSGLCAGIHGLTIADAAGATAIVTFAVASTEHIYSNLPFDVNWTDTLASTTWNCDLDFNLPIDSFTVATEAACFVPDSCLITFTLYQAGASFVITASFPMAQDPGLQVLSLVIGCENGRALAGIFQLFALWDAPAGVAHGLSVMMPVAYPNPGSGFFRFAHLHADMVLLGITDMLGRPMVHSTTHDALGLLLHLPAATDGFYMALLRDGQGDMRALRLLVAH